MQLFYLDQTPESEFNLNREESRHLVRVLRRKRGDLVHFTDGLGKEFIAEIIDDDQSGVRLQLRSEKEHERPEFRFHLAISPPKKLDRIEWCLEKCVEMGLDEFSIIYTERTELSKIKLDRLERIALSAMKQSQQFFLPVIHEPISFKTFLEQEQEGQLYIAHCEDSDRLEFSSIEPVQKCTILIGPEGDFSPEEIDLAIKKGAKAVALGNSRLRTETAGVFACAVWRHKLLEHES